MDQFNQNLMQNFARVIWHWPSDISALFTAERDTWSRWTDRGDFSNQFIFVATSTFNFRLSQTFLLSEMASRCGKVGAKMGWQVLSADSRLPERTVDKQLWSVRSKHFRVDAQSSLVRTTKYSHRSTDVCQIANLTPTQIEELRPRKSLFYLSQKLPQLAASIQDKQLYCPIKSFLLTSEDVREFFGFDFR